MVCDCHLTISLITEAGGPMNVGSRQAAGPPVDMRQNYGGGGGGYDRSSDRRPVPSSNDDRSDRSGRAAVSGSDEPFSGLSQHLVRFVWFPSDPFKIQENKVTLLSSFTVSYTFVRTVRISKTSLVWVYSSNATSLQIWFFRVYNVYNNIYQVYYTYLSVINGHFYFFKLKLCLSQ